MPNLLHEWSETFRKLHPDWKYLLWDNDLVGKLIPTTLANTPALSTYCGISSYIRLMAVYTFGGIYADMDCECIKPVNDLLKYDAFVGEYADVPNRVCPAVFGAVARHPWVGWQLDHFDDADAFPGAPVDWMSNAPREGVTVLPEHYFYPYRWDGPSGSDHPDTYIVHHWMKMWDKVK